MPRSIDETEFEDAAKTVVRLRAVSRKISDGETSLWKALCVVMSDHDFQFFAVGEAFFIARAGHDIGTLIIPKEEGFFNFNYVKNGTITLVPYDPADIPKFMDRLRARTDEVISGIVEPPPTPAKELLRKTLRVRRKPYDAKPD